MAVDGSTRTGAIGTPALSPATVVERFAARLVDILVVGGIVGLGAVVLYQPVSSFVRGDGADLVALDYAGPALYLLGVVVAVQWLWWWSAKEGLSPGRNVMGLRLVGPDGYPIGFMAVLRRTLTGLGLELLLPVVGTVVNAVVLLRGRHQRSAALHDMAGGAAVVRAVPLPSATSATYAGAGGTRLPKRRDQLWPGYQPGMVLGATNPWELPSPDGVAEPARSTPQPAGAPIVKERVTELSGYVRDITAKPASQRPAHRRAPVVDPAQAAPTGRKSGPTSAVPPVTVTAEVEVLAAATGSEALSAEADAITGQHQVAAELPSPEISELRAAIREEEKAVQEVREKTSFGRTRQTSEAGGQGGAEPVDSFDGEQPTTPVPSWQPASGVSARAPQGAGVSGYTPKRTATAVNYPSSVDALTPPVGVRVHTDSADFQGATVAGEAPAVAPGRRDGQLYVQPTFDDNPEYPSGLAARVLKKSATEVRAETSGSNEILRSQGGEPSAGITMSGEVGDQDVSSGMNMSRAEPLVYNPNDRDLIWLLLGSDGQSLIVDAKCMIGRKPDVTDPDTPGVLALPIRDDSLSVSKTHAMLGLDADGLWVMDWDSRNGTFVAPAGQQWEQLEPRQAYRLLDGDFIKFGSVEFGVQLQRESMLGQQYPEGM